MKPVYQKLRPILLTVLSLGVGYLTISVTTALLYSVWLSDEGHTFTSQFLAFAAIAGLGFATLSGYLAALVAQRSPVKHAALLSLMLTVIWAISSFLFGSIETLFISLLNIAIALSGVMTGGWLRYIQIATQPATDNPETLPAES